VSSLVGVGGRIVYLGVDDDEQLQLIGLDPSTGDVAWQRPSTAATHIDGVEQHLVTNGNFVFNVEPPSGGGSTRVAVPAQADAGADVVAIDARTGKDVWHHPFPDLMTPLDACGTTVCVQANGSAGHLAITRLDFATGAVLSEGRAAFEPIVAEDGELAISASRSNDEIALTNGFGTNVVWTHTRSEFFGTSDVTPDGGWFGVHRDGVWVIWLGSAIPTGAPAPSVGAVSGISDDGRLLWTRPGTAPCVPFIDDEPAPPVLCRLRDDALSHTSTVESVDAATGETRWSVKIGELVVGGSGDALVRTSSTAYATHTADGQGVTVDTIAGPSAPGPSPIEGWCQILGQKTKVEGDVHVLARAWSPCTLDDGPNETPPTSVPAFAGPTVDGFGAWVEDGEVRAAKVR
jgi:outer membrane protein assembly factor BamB